MLDVSIISMLEKEYGYEQYSEKSILESLGNSNYINLIIFKNELPIGYVSACVQYDNCDLLKIVVKAAERRHGYGKVLISTLVEVLKQSHVKSVFLEVRCDNFPALDFYKKMGFEKLSERKNYYRDGMTAEIYRLEINE